jgi:hypothetical protein
VFGAVADGGAGAGLALGGAITEYLSWRWQWQAARWCCLTAQVMPGPGERRHARRGLGRGRLAALVRGFAAAAVRGWAAPLTTSLLAASAALLAAFVAAEARAAHPILPRLG